MKHNGHALRRNGHELEYHTMMIPGMAVLLIFSVLPMVGLLMAFEYYEPAAPWFGLKSEWVGLQNFITMFFKHPNSQQAIVNTIIIAVSKIALNLIVPVIFALLLNELFSRRSQRFIQTVVVLPNFLSWVVVGAMFKQGIFGGVGIINNALQALGLVSQPIDFISSNIWMRPIVILTEVWKGFGYSAIIYTAAITSIDIGLYEAAEIDGANRWQKMRYVTLSGIMPTIILMATLSLGGILNAGQDQILNLYNTTSYQSIDIIDTFVYRIALREGQFHMGTALGLAKSVISMVLILISYKLADKFAGYRIF